MRILPGLAMSTSQNGESRKRGLQPIKESLFKLDGMALDMGRHALAYGSKACVLMGNHYQAGILRILAGTNGVSQQGLAQMLGMYASRLVAVIDAMERSKLVERRVRVSDRRIFEIHLTAKGKERLAAVSKIAREHQEMLCRSLTPLEQETLAELLERIAVDRKLAPRWRYHQGQRLDVCSIWEVRAPEKEARLSRSRRQFDFGPTAAEQSNDAPPRGCLRSRSRR